MMFNAFCILLGCFFIHPDRDQEIPDDLMAFFAFFCQFLAGFCQENRPIGARIDQTILLQSLDSGINSWGSYPETLSQIDRTGFACILDKLGYHFHIIFCHLILVSFANPLKFRGAICDGIAHLKNILIIERQNQISIKC